MAVSLDALARDWDDESSGLESILRGLAAEDWNLPTPAAGWAVRHQVAHLTWTDKALHSALTAPDDFETLRARVAADAGAVVGDAAEAGTGVAPGALLDGWVAGRRLTAGAILAAEPSRRIPWFGPPMGLAAAVTARIMETFAHGQDIRDALSLSPSPSPRLRHIAHLAVAARDYSFGINGLQAPTERIRVELSHDAESWSWGPEDAEQFVRGDALDFALLATRRRHRDDCDVRAQGVDAVQWLSIAQAYAGPPGTGRARLRAASA